MVKELYTRELEELEEPRLAADVKEIEGAIGILTQAGFHPLRNGNGSILLKDAETLERPERVAVALVQAGYPPSRLVVERGDLESYFLKLVGGEKEAK